MTAFDRNSLVTRENDEADCLDEAVARRLVHIKTF